MSNQATRSDSPRPVPNVKLNVANIVIRDGKTIDAALGAADAKVVA